MRRNAAERLARKNWDAGRAIVETDNGDRSSREVVSSEAIEAPPHIAAGFGLPPGAEVWRHRVRHFIDGRLIQHATSYLDVELVGDARDALTEADILGIFALLRSLKRAPVRIREELRSRVPAADETDALGITGQTPVLLLAQTAFDAEERPVVITELLLDSSSYLLEYEFSV
jgi:GntR family transcriptional regulator